MIFTLKTVLIQTQMFVATICIRPKRAKHLNCWMFSWKKNLWVYVEWMFKLFSKNIQISDDVHNIFYPCWIICLHDSLSLTKYLSQLTTFIPHILIKFTLRYSECHFHPWRKSPSYYFLPRWTKGTKVNTADCSTPLNASSQQIHKYTDTNTKTKTKTKGTKVNTADCSTPLNASFRQIHIFVSSGIFISQTIFLNHF